jgi:putative ABC transport system permease protein
MTRFSVSLWPLAFRQLRRDFASGQLHWLMLAVVLAVAALTCVAFFADRLHKGMARDARQMLGGDVVVVSDQAVPASFETQALKQNMQVASSATFASMGRAPPERGGASKLVAVKAVGVGYPLRGQVQLQGKLGAAQYQASGPPEQGQVWVDAAVLDALELSVGDSLLLGDASLRIAATILLEPDRGAGFMNFSPRVMLNQIDLASTGLVQPASRVTYRLAVATANAFDEKTRLAYTTWAQDHIVGLGLRGLRLESLESGRPEMKITLERAEQFLNLVALLAAVLAAVAVAVASRSFANQHLDDCAMLRVLGLAQRQLVLQYLIEFGVAGLLASGAGVLLGLLVHQVFVWLLADLLSSALPSVGLWPALLGFGVGMTLLLGFGLAPVLQLAQVPPLRVMRRDVGSPKPASWGVWVSGLAGLVVLLLTTASEPKLGLIAVGGFALAGLVFAALSWVAMQLLRRVVPQSRSPRWLVLATRQVASRPAFAVLQISSLSLGLLALLLLVLLRTDLVSNWRQATPANAPDRFAINVLPDQGDAFQAQLRSAGVVGYDWYPMFRGRLVAVNGQTISPDTVREERAKRLLDREFNLSHSAVLPAHNQVSAGDWTPEEAGALSVEQGLADTLGLRLDDRLQFDIAGQLLEAKITSLRKLDWSSMHANFFVMFPTALMPDIPSTFMAAFHAPKTAGFDAALSRDFPNLTVVDVSATRDQIQRVLNQVIRAVEFLFVFTLATGLVVVFTTLSGTREVRAHEFAVMRALGASNSLLAQVQRTELLGIGALAGFLASTAASALGAALAGQVFQFVWIPSAWTWVTGTSLGALIAWFAGWWSLRKVLRRPVVELLRSSS